jgi:hypothetical protein
MGRRLPLADSELVAPIRTQQAWVRARFRLTPAERLCLLPRPHKNVDGTNHLTPALLNAWMRNWVARIPRIDAGPLDGQGDPCRWTGVPSIPTRSGTPTPRPWPTPAWAPSVLRDLMDHRSLSTTLGYYRVGEARKRAAMESLPANMVDNRGVTRPVDGEPSSVTHLREHLSWVAVPWAKCSEPTNVRAGGQACPIRYQCAGCPHFESDPS